MSTKKDRELQQRVQFQELQERVTFQRLLMDTVPVPGFYKNAEGEYLGCNKAFEIFFGQRTEQIMGKAALDISLKEFADICREKDRALLQNPGSQTFESSIKDRDGVAHDVVVHKATFPAPDGSVGGVVGAIIDVTDRKRAEEALRTSRQILEGIINAIPVRVFWKDNKLVYLGCNAIFARDAGFAAPKDVIGKDDFQMEWRAHAEAYRSDDRQVIESGCSKLLIEEPQTTPEGQTITILTNKIPLRGSQGEIIGVLGTYMDITERKRAEEKLQLTLADLERSNQELMQFAYVASHDLQEPLRMVSSYTQLLARRYQGKLDSDADEFIAYAVDGANRMQALINDLLAYSRVGTRNQASEPTDCAAALDHALANLKVAMEQSAAAVTYDALPTVNGNKSQFTQLFQNLVGNALKFRGAEPARIHVSAERKGNEWVFSVRDNGIGIDPQYAERIFVLFQRLHTRDEYPGTGIGLAICKKIVERQGGHIWVTSRLGAGSTFSFTIPSGEPGEQPS